MSGKNPLEPCLGEKHLRTMSGKNTLEPSLEKKPLEPCLGGKTPENHVWGKIP
jgi:hypothetical protein